MDSVTKSPSFRSFNSNFQSYKPLTATHLSFFKVTSFNFKKLKASCITSCCRTPSNPVNPNSNGDNQNLPLNPIWALIPILQSIKHLATCRTQRWVSWFRAYSDSDKVVDEYSGCYLQNGGLGIALISVTTNAKIRISPFVATLAANPTFVSGFLAWMIAQSTKVFLNFFVEKKWDLRILCSSGGMPSSHTALCTALTTSVALCHGVADSLFPVCLGFSLIVMYDAIGVRRHAGMQAEVLNMIVADLFQGHPISQRKLKELLGHTPSQVIAGALLGILVACFCCQGTPRNIFELDHSCL
ncbi:Acid phosphatase/vanadium-dependent haloperoxidase-related protein [Quillaja saponaria]|uniref:Acid phosphatase/vanadium-dependent haloperoxidase-related protein n=1 Tax=Quillaja saponaria TaxID=32244 RepID=A0AAD7PPY6_QUISA|nr:Acid phosphatase/vanadium-dependent haloperoxidase-related protein [Quillaja saponaria]